MIGELDALIDMIDIVYDNTVEESENNDTIATILACVNDLDSSRTQQLAIDLGLPEELMWELDGLSFPHGDPLQALNTLVNKQPKKNPAKIIHEFSVVERDGRYYPSVEVEDVDVKIDNTYIKGLIKLVPKDLLEIEEIDYGDHTERVPNDFLAMILSICKTYRPRFYSHIFKWIQEHYLYLPVEDLDTFKKVDADKADISVLRALALRYKPGAYYELHEKLGANHNEHAGVVPQQTNVADTVKEVPTIHVSPGPYNPQEPYYIDDYISEIQDRKYTGETLAECLAEFRVHSITLLHKCFRYYRGANRFNVVKASAKEPFKISRTDISAIYPKKDHNVVCHYRSKGEMTTKCVSIFKYAYDNILSFRDIEDVPYVGDEYITSDIRTLNIFPRYQAKILDNYDITKIQPILDHMKEILSNGNEDMYTYLLNWTAHPFINPGKKSKSEVCVVLFGPQGLGKGVFTLFLVDYVYGKACALNIPNMSKILGKFNSLIAGKCLVCAEEQSKKTINEEQLDLLKSLITTTHQVIERKGIDPIEVESYTNTIISTNNINSVKVVEGQRRQAVFHCNDKYVDDKQHFKTTFFNKGCCLGDEETSRETADHFLTYLVKGDYPRINIREIPHNETEEEMIDLSVSSQEYFIRCVLRGEIPLDLEKSIFMHSTDGFWYSHSENLYALYQVWCTENGNKATSSRVCKSDWKKKFGKDNVRERVSHKYVDGTSRRGVAYLIEPKYYKSIEVTHQDHFLIVDGKMTRERGSISMTLEEYIVGYYS